MTQRRLFLSAGLCTLVATRIAVAAGDASHAVVGTKAPDFKVADTAGRVRSLVEFKGHTVVLEWTSPSCPFAKAQYDSGRMQELQKWAEAKDVVWLTVLSSHPSRSDYLAPAKAEALIRARGGVPTALLIDASGDVGHTYGAKTANHMFIVGKDGVLVYAGGIDDGQTMDAMKVLKAHNYVRAALEDIVGGRPVRVANTDPFGCSIAYAG
jgi:peroxiredoxin